MTKEKLVEMGLTEEQAGKVMASLDGAYVTKSRFDEVNSAKKQLETQLKDRDAQLDELKKIDAEGLRKQIEALQAENEAAAERYETEIKRFRLESAVDRTLAEAKARNVKAAAALLDLSAVQLQEDGTVKGLGEQIKKLSESPDSSFLFESARPKQGFKGFKPGESAEGKSGGMTLETLRKMTPSERYAYSVNNPSEYKQLYGGDLNG